MLKTFKKLVIRATVEVVGYKVSGRGKKGSAWWMAEIKEAVKEKKSA